jgi:hypothetical protein
MMCNVALLFLFATTKIISTRWVLTSREEGGRGLPTEVLLVVPTRQLAVRRHSGTTTSRSACGLANLVVLGGVAFQA